MNNKDEVSKIEFSPKGKYSNPASKPKSQNPLIKTNLRQDVDRHNQVKECIRFIHKHHELCFCGRKEIDHIKDLSESEKERSKSTDKWDPELDLVPRKTQNDGDMKLTSFVRVIAGVNPKTSLSQYVDRHIRVKECIRFIHKHHELCFCGRKEIEHLKDLSESEKERSKSTDKWDPKLDMVPKKTQNYGDMKLTGFVRVIAGVNPKYIQAGDVLGIEEHVYNIMTHYWLIQKPELIISINGGAKKMQPLNNDQKLAFKRGLIEVSKNAPTWITTGGFRFGVSRLVGEAAKDFSIVSEEKMFSVIGIGTWGATFNRHQLVKTKGTDKVTYENMKGNEMIKGQASIDPYHDALILYDNGISRTFGQEILFRSNFETYVSNQAQCSVVQLMVEGGKKSIMTASTALNSGTPLVVMKGSKRASDVICDVITAMEGTVIEMIDAYLDDYTIEWTLSEDDIKVLRRDLLNIRKKYEENKMVHIFNMCDFNKNLDKMILEAAFSGTIGGKQLSNENKLQLSMTYNRADVAEEKIFENSEINLKEENIHFIKKALYRDQWLFMDLFLSHGLTVESFLTEKILRDLYFGIESTKYLNSNVKVILESLTKTKVNEDPTCLHVVGRMIKDLSENLLLMYKTAQRKCKTCSDTQTNDYRYPDKIDVYKKYNREVAVFKKKKKNETIMRRYIYTEFPPHNATYEIILTEQDLFIWALITMRFEMAKVFWKAGKDHIGSALIATVICRSLAKKAEKQGEVEMMNKIMQVKQEFLQLAINILSEAYWRDKLRTHLLLIRALPFIGRESCMDIADKNQIIDFLFHSACQTRLNTIWLGGMSAYTHVAIIILNLPLGFLTTKLLIMPNTNKKIKNGQVKPITIISSENQPEEISDQNPTVQEMKETEEAERVAMMIKNPKERRMFLEKFRYRQQESWRNVPWAKAVRIYYRAPITKFMLNLISYTCFLAIFTCFCLWELKPNVPSNTHDKRILEYIVYVFFATFVLEEMRQIFTSQGNMTMESRLQDWISSLWNIFDLIMYICFLIAVVLRHINAIDFVYARTMFSFTLSLFCLRFMQFYYAHKSLGPKVIMISRMMKDIGFFLAIYIIAVFAYGTFAQALLSPNSEINGLLLKNIVYLPYWQTYGELNLEYVEGANTPSSNPMVVVAFVIFMLFSNILLLNLLIAMFGNTFAKVEENSNRIWAFTRYRLIEEFYYRPILPPPLNIFEIVFYAVQGLFHCFRSSSKLSIDEFVVNLTHDEDIQCSGFEQQCMEHYLQDNPLFEIQKNETDSKSGLSLGMQVEMKQGGQKTAKETNGGTRDSLQLSLCNNLKEMKEDMAKLSRKVQKIRRHQKKQNESMSKSVDMSQHRPSTSVTD